MSETAVDFNFCAEADRMLLAARFLAELDLAGICETVERAHTLGPFVDPTRYRDALYRGDMDDVAHLASALREPQRIAREIIAKHGKLTGLLAIEAPKGDHHG